MTADAATFAAIIVAGGAGTRLSGVSKPGLVIAGRTLMDRTMDACAGASHVVIVGGEHLKRDDALWTCEDPPGSGPAAGLAAGLAALDAEGDASALVLVLGADTPRAHEGVAALFARLLEGSDAADGGGGSAVGEDAVGEGSDGAWLVDGSGFAQPLIAVYRRAAIAARCAADAAPGASLRSVTGGLDMTAVDDVYEASRDVDTWEDVQYWEGKLS